MQKVYNKKQDLRSDLKAISSFRNLIMHSNRKIELDAQFSTVLKRKGQLDMLIRAMRAIMKKQKDKHGVWI